MIKSSLILILTLITSYVVIGQESTGFYDFEMKTLEGESFDFSSLKGKKVMIVNTASRCSLTPQYKRLQSIYEQYGGENFIVIGFPANNFLNQEPGTNEEIRSFCTEKYEVTFPMMEKTDVKGDNMHPVYKWLTSKALNGVKNSKVRWNFQKYLIDENGTLVKIIPPRIKPDNTSIIKWIKEK